MAHGACLSAYSLPQIIMQLHFLHIAVTALSVIIALGWLCTHDATLPTCELCLEPVGFRCVNINESGPYGQAVATKALTRLPRFLHSFSCCHPCQNLLSTPQRGIGHAAEGQNVCLLSAASSVHVGKHRSAVQSKCRICCRRAVIAQHSEKWLTAGL